MQAPELVDDAPDAPIEFIQYIAPDAAGIFVGELLVRHTRYVNVAGCEVQEEWLVVVFLDELDGLVRERGCHVLVCPAS